MITHWGQPIARIIPENKTLKPIPFGNDSALLIFIKNFTQRRKDAKESKITLRK
jgi:antitoxin (DNA-binding transcriptional repressor) of toxin-antitoxin stability system